MLDRTTPDRTKLPGPAGPRDASRRAFFRRSATTAAAVPAMVLASSAASQAGGGGNGLTGATRAQLQSLFTEILDDELAHVEILQALLMDPDNTIPPRQVPTFRNLEQPTLLDFVRGAAIFENTGSGAYGGALFAIQQTDEYFPLATGITTVEARHAGWINAILDQPLVPDFFPSEGAIPQSTALSHIDPFIAAINGSVPSFDPVHASDANNFAILDFLLLLEFVESNYYAVNVRKFFG
ncbi:MAG TPA: ferritin-like domain-containing protein [Isosphaeraceae bacterium]|jgi:hypothetical protein|nr:ferritin-like domain-containing protein [Isosphaeraceae bacterium]